MRIRTYNPQKKSKLNKGEAFPVLIDVGATFANLGSLFAFFFSSFLLSMRTFFKTKKSLREFQARHEKIYDLR